jgi:acyl carrier protein
MQVVAHTLSLPANKVQRASHFERDLKADALNMVEVMLALESEFGIVIPDTEADKVKTVADAVALIEGLLAAKRG